MYPAFYNIIWSGEEVLSEDGFEINLTEVYGNIFVNIGLGTEGNLSMRARLSVRHRVDD